jgi:light-regulated signal transduction histidine kinase (bacteriophytochrome)
MTRAGRPQPLPAHAGQEGKRDSAKAKAALGEATLQSENLRLRRRVKELERENDQLEQFVAIAAHELVKPLVVTEEYATAIRARIAHGLDLASRRDLESLIQVTSRMRVLVETLLLDARAGDEPLRLHRVDLAEVVRECLVTLAADLEAHQSSVEVDPLPVVRGNAALLSGVFGNLIVNALKYSAGGSEIQVTAMRSEANWVIAVDSPGREIPENERQSIFEPWKRGSNSRRVRGRGMGLAMVRRVVERHGGHVGVTRAGDSVNRFFFTLPA